MIPTPFADLLIGLRFFSRLPVPVTPRETALGAEGVARSVLMVPVAGAVIGLCPALVLAAAGLCGLPPLVAAPLALATLVGVTGALHEDGLADCADGFGGGRTRERKLEIMRDSRIGTFGACAIGLSLYLRAASITVIVAQDPARAAAVLVAAAALSRVACLLPLMLLPPARADGAGVAFGAIDPVRYGIAIGIALVIAALPWFAGAGAGSCLLAGILAAVTAGAICVLARRQIGGHTGDVAGLVQQKVECVVLLVFAATL